MIRKYYLYLIVAACLTVFLNGFAIAADSSGRDFLELADNYKNFAEFDKSMKFCDKSIAILNSTPDKTKDIFRSLSKAYYLRANLLNYMQAGDDKIKSELFSAMLSDPDYIPPENYTNHPKIVKLIKTTKINYENYVTNTFDKAMILFTEEKFCLAREYLLPIAHRYKNPKLAGNILKKCESKCFANKIEVAEKDKKQANEKDGEKAVKPQFKEISGNAIGILPVSWDTAFNEGDRLNGSKYMNQEALGKNLNNFVTGYGIKKVSAEEMVRVNSQLGINDLNGFIIEEGDYDVDSVDKLLKGIFQGGFDKGTKGMLDPQKQEKLRDIFRSTGVKYLILSKVIKNPNADNEDNKKYLVVLNLWDYDKLQLPMHAVNIKTTTLRYVIFNLASFSTRTQDYLNP